MLEKAYKKHWTVAEFMEAIDQLDGKCRHPKLEDKLGTCPDCGQEIKYEFSEYKPPKYRAFNPAVDDETQYTQEVLDLVSHDIEGYF